MTETMTRRDRDDLAKVARMRARLAKDGIAAREAALLADVEEQLSAVYKFDHDAWADITRHAQQLIKDADRQIAERCRELGIREEFRPKLELGWMRRGENASSERRGELRRTSQTRIAALGKEAKMAIDGRAAEILTELIAGGLESEDAKAFLATIPTAEHLMPRLTLPELEAAEHDSKTRALRRAAEGAW
ncbi:MAG: hypothetical protein ACRDOK_27340 [Streptosporangiaceae bacterium]